MASGTEANNAVVASLLGESAPGDRIVVSALEHPSILGAAQAWAARAGVAVAVVPPEGDGVVSASRMAGAAAPGRGLPP